MPHVRIVGQFPVTRRDARPSRTTRKSYGPRVPDRTMVATFDHVLLCWFRNGQASLPRSDQNRWAYMPSNRAHGTAVQNRSCSTKRAAKQENLQPLERCFFLTSTFIELTRH